MVKYCFRSKNKLVPCLSEFSFIFSSTSLRVFCCTPSAGGVFHFFPLWPGCFLLRSNHGHALVQMCSRPPSSKKGAGYFCCVSHLCSSFSLLVGRLCLMVQPPTVTAMATDLSWPDLVFCSSGGVFISALCASLELHACALRPQSITAWVFIVITMVIFYLSTSN